MKAFVQWRVILLGILSVIFVFSACKKEPGRVGLGLHENDLVDVNYIDTVSLRAYSVRVDSLGTSGLLYNLLGSRMDAVLGLTNASFYTQLRPQSVGYDFGEFPVMDSMVLTMLYQGFYGNISTEQTIRVYEVGEKMLLDTAYFSNHSLENLGVEIGNKTFIPNPTDSVPIGSDTLPAHIRVNLSAEFAQKLFDSPPEASSSIEDGFLDYIKGLYITTDAVTSGGAILYLNMISSFSKVTVYYSNEHNDSLYFNLPINEYCVRFNNYDHNNYQDASPEFISQVNDGDTILGSQTLYLQPMAGVKSNIFFPHIKELNNLGKIAINDANLVITGVEVPQDFDAPDKLTLIRTNSEGDSEFLPDYFDGEAYYGGTYDSITHSFTFRISRYIQYLLSDYGQDYGLNLMVSSSSSQANHFIFHGTNPESETANEDRLKLKLIYTIID